ncbi:carbonic anhydrase [Synechococcus sp. KORDI-52]|uniref:carbonic anhydrase n=1 Tax=Synechococcus sp. KORDI-52 TaxID=585425 RepID=UPI0004E087D4|nr:carbonic anhydrase [Synechococcus sp. KORDI-52]AII48076.1 carbonic anhydrase [Synechococcus sp. KORDI-52]
MGIHRRHFLQKTGGLALTALMQPRAVEAAEDGFCVPNDPLQTLMAGNNRFAEAWRRAEGDNRAPLRGADPDPRCFNAPSALATGQHPWATVLTCSDSRVSPNWVFDTTPGELFVIRNAGNSAFTEAIASVEYGVSVLKTPLLMVMGHSGCGAVTAAMDANPLTPSLDRLIKPIRENINGSSDLEDAVQRNALASASTLIQRSTVLADAKASGALKLVVGCFQLNSGVVSLIE